LRACLTALHRLRRADDKSAALDAEEAFTTLRMTFKDADGAARQWSCDQE